MKYSILSFLLLSLMAPVQTAPVLNAAMTVPPSSCGQQDDEKKPEDDDDEEPTVEDQLLEIRKDLQATIKDLGVTFRAAKTEEARQAVSEKRTAAEKAAVAKAIEFYKTNDSERVNVRSMADLASRTRGAARKRLLDAAVELHGKSAGIKRLVDTVGRRPATPESHEFMQQVVSTSDHENLQGLATMYQAKFAGEILNMANIQRKSLTKLHGKSFATYSETWSGDAGEEKLIALLDTLIEDFGDIKNGRQTLAAFATGQKGQLNLKVGKVAPDIIGEDLDGESFKLSDYRGKLVMLDFWGDW